MQFEVIDVSNVRVLSKARVIAEPGLNLVFGCNGSGKTSLLEAIHLLSRARSFRTMKLNEVIREGEKSLLVTASVVMDNKQVISSGVERKGKETRIKFGGTDIHRVSEQVRNLPVLVLTPENLGLLNSAPKERRRWMDWMMFHVKPDYLELWSDYQKNLRHRNHLLRSRARPAEFLPWEQKLSTLAVGMHELCSGLMQNMEDKLQSELKLVLPGAAEILYQRGWNNDELLEEILDKNRQADMDTGYTCSGPHRADVIFRHEGKPARETLSRGQIKLYMAALLLAQAGLIKEVTGETPVVLIDDVFAELDGEARDRLSQRLSALDVQCFITSTEEDMKNYCSALFHVKQGKIEKHNLVEN